MPARYAGRWADPDPAMVSASSRVVVTRLSRSSRAHFFECGLPRVGEPARLTTTSALRTRVRSSCPAYGSQVDSSGPLARAGPGR